jgi:hypothetical protein
MSDPLREDPRAPGEGDHPADRPAKIEELLLIGLDHYFALQHEQAINVWTRVLFLDRGHARARAYIERARSALAERQREGDELLHTGVAAFERGDVDAARTLLTSAVERGGAPEVALALLQRLDRLDGSARPGRAMPLPLVRERSDRLPEPAAPPRAPRRRIGTLPVALLVGLASAGIYAAASWDRIEPMLFPRRSQPLTSVVSSRAVERVPLPAPGEFALARARQLFDRGHLHECLTALDEIQIGDALKPEADLLRAAVQRALLAGTAPVSGSTAPVQDPR